MADILSGTIEPVRVPVLRKKILKFHIVGLGILNFFWARNNVIDIDKKNKPGTWWILHVRQGTTISVSFTSTAYLQGVVPHWPALTGRRGPGIGNLISDARGDLVLGRPVVLGHRSKFLEPSPGAIPGFFRIAVENYNSQYVASRIVIYHLQ